MKISTKSSGTVITRPMQGEFFDSEVMEAIVNNLDLGE